MKPTRIGFLGLNAVGAYFGGTLATNFFCSKEVEVIFLTSPEVVKLIKRSGLRINTPTSTEMIFPHKVVSDSAGVGPLDYIICSSKTYELDRALFHAQHSVTKDTVFIPLLNGLDSKEAINFTYPDNEVWEGCVDLVAKMIAPAIVKESGKVQTIIYGSDTGSKVKMKELERIFKDGEIDVVISDNIEKSLWEKFIFISPFASLTSFKYKPIGKILNERDNRKMLLALITEMKLIADAKNIPLADDIVKVTYKKIRKLPKDASSSMLRDYIIGDSSEYLTLTKYVTDLARQLNIKTPAYDRIMFEFRRRELFRVY